MGTSARINEMEIDAIDVRFTKEISVKIFK